MRTNRRHLTGLAILLIASLLLAACGRLGAPATAGFAQGEAGIPSSDGPVAPEWILETLSGGSFQLADHQGDVVVMFFPAAASTPGEPRRSGFRS